MPSNKWQSVEANVRESERENERSEESKESEEMREMRDEIEAVSYTHLTLPTICSV